jgi:UDP-N-acetylmuramoyl-tripeptide--D-alanyl-D-alanine ligase
MKDRRQIRRIGLRIEHACDSTHRTSSTLVAQYSGGVLAYVRMESWRFRRRVAMMLWHVKVAMMFAAAFVWRRLLVKTTFIAITGSVGKTSAKEMLAAILATRYPTAKSFANQNDYSGVPRSLLHVRPWHRFAVLEVAANGRGLMLRSAPLVRPDIAVVLTVAATHRKEFRTLDRTAAEKATLLAALRPSGTAVLNGDDPHVAAMADGLRPRVVWFGSSPGFDYRAERMASSWPERTSFELSAGSQSFIVRSRLLGPQWQSSILAALAVADLCGIPLPEAIAAAAGVEPVTARMQAVDLPCGAVMIRDDYGGSHHTLLSALAFLEHAAAVRKLLVFSDMTDTSMSPRERFAWIGRYAARCLDGVVFVGEQSQRGVRAAIAAGMPATAAHAFADVHAAALFLRRELMSGDLVLLKGRSCDHMARLYYGLIGSVACRKTACDKTIVCDLCPELGARPDGP